MKFLIFSFCICAAFFSCEEKTVKEPGGAITAAEKDNEVMDTFKGQAILPFDPGNIIIDTKNHNPAEVLNFATTLIGVTYKYGSTDPQEGFDCSGFITYVFNYFDIAVPRSSIDFTNIGTEVNEQMAAPGDLILFTGTDSTIRTVGHMGIVIENTDSLRFIHSTSGKKYGVTITAVNPTYKKRFVKVIRIFKELI